MSIKTCRLKVVGSLNNFHVTGIEALHRRVSVGSSSLLVELCIKVDPGDVSREDGICCW